MSSPHIPHAHSAYFYPVSGILGELYTVNIGVGFTLPFQIFGTEWVEDAELLADNLNELEIPGVIFRPIHFRPYYTNMKDKRMRGVQVHLFDLKEAPLSLIQFYVIQEMHKLHPEYNIFELAPERLDMFDKVCGTDKVRIAFEENFMVEDIIDLWTRELPGFLEVATRYFLY